MSSRTNQMQAPKQRPLYTNYQGLKKCYGYFFCQRPYGRYDICGTRWESDESYANCWQKCPKCHNCVYPHTQVCYIFNYK